MWENKAYNATLSSCNRELQWASSASVCVTYTDLTLLPHYTFSYSNSIRCLLPLGPHVNHVWAQDWTLPQLSLLCLLPNFFTDWRQKKKMCVRRVDCPLSLLKRKGRVGHTQRDTSHKCPVQPQSCTAGRRAAPLGQMGCKLLCRRVLQQFSSWGLESTYHTIPLPRLSQQVLRVKPLTFWSLLLRCCCLKQPSRILHRCSL